MSWGTLLVGDARGRLPDTPDLSSRVGEEPSQARAPGTLVHHLADCVGTAGGQPRVARVNALVVDARLGRGTVGVELAANLAHVVQADVAEQKTIGQQTASQYRK